MTGTSISDPSKATHYLEAAYASEERHEFEQALEECEAALRLDPGLAEAHNFRGVILDELGRKQEAIAAYREAVRLDPTFLEAQENLDDVENELRGAGQRAPAVEGGGAPFGGNQALADYVLKMGGVGRVGLNVICFIGLFLFGWLLAVAFDLLGKRTLGWVYVGSIILLLAFSRFVEPSLAIIPAVLYVVGWIHANLVLSSYRSQARDRIAELNRLPENRMTANALMEKGILQGKVLTEQKAAAATLAQALRMPGGDAQLLNLAGLVMFAQKRYGEAKAFFSKALPVATDPALIKQIQRNQVNAEKRIR